MDDPIIEPSTDNILIDMSVPITYAPINLKGDKGDKGDRGTKGEKGDVGSICIISPESPVSPNLYYIKISRSKLRPSVVKANVPNPFIINEDGLVVFIDTLFCR